MDEKKKNHSIDTELVAKASKELDAEIQEELELPDPDVALGTFVITSEDVRILEEADNEDTE